MPTSAKANSPIAEPASYRKAISDPCYRKQWEQAIDAELRVLEAFGTWRLVDAREVAGRKPIS